MSSPEQRLSPDMCEHGNFRNTCTKCNARSVLGIKREDFTGMVQSFRGKQVIRYEQGEKAIFSKLATRHNGSGENINRLKHERDILEKMHDTGISPKVISYKEYGEDKARLLIEELSGKSVDKMPLQEKKEFAQKNAKDIVRETGRVLSEIHKLGIFVVDVNEGTFLFNTEEDNVLGVSVLDLEFAIDTESANEEDFQESFAHFKKGDLGFMLAEQEGTALPENEELLRKAELYKWANTMKRTLIGKHANLEISKSKQEHLVAYQERIRPVLERKLLERAARIFTKIQARNSESDSVSIVKGLDKYSEDYVRKSIKYEQYVAGMTYTFPELCKANGVDIPEQYAEFIAQCLNLDINLRPDSLEGLVNKEVTEQG
jgi:serine/threonine protein kinase